MNSSPEYLGHRSSALGRPGHGILTGPTLYAAVAAEASGGKFYSPDQNSGHQGYPAEATIAPHALNETVARYL